MSTTDNTQIHSMTGFATAEATLGVSAVQVVLRSLNHRHLDIRLYLPDDLRDSEEQWTTKIRSHIRRGRVEATVRVEERVEAGDVTFDRELVRQVAREVAELGEQGLISGGLSGGDLLSWPPALRSRSQPADAEALAAAVDGCFDQALSELVAARRREGDRLGVFLLERLHRIEILGAELVERRAQVEAGLAEDYRRRLADLGAGEQLSEERVALEVAAAIDKSSISEETDRLIAHCEHFRDIATSKRPSGRKLDFIVQEIFRELNTIAAKGRDSASVHLAIEGKTICEDLREQLRNVE